MSENIEKAVQTEESSETKVTEATAPAATDNVVLYPISDEEKTVSAAQETSDTESKATDGKTADNTNKFSDTQIQKNLHQKMRKKKKTTMTWKRISTNNRKNPAPKMSIRSANFSPISVPNARLR